MFWFESLCDECLCLGYICRKFWGIEEIIRRMIFGICVGFIEVVYYSEVGFLVCVVENYMFVV